MSVHNMFLMKSSIVEGDGESCFYLVILLGQVIVHVYLESELFRQACEERILSFFSFFSSFSGLICHLLHHPEMCLGL